LVKGLKTKIENGGSEFWQDVHKQESRPWLESLEADIKRSKRASQEVTIQAFDVAAFTRTMKYYEKRQDEEKADTDEAAKAMSAVESVEPTSEVAKLQEKLDKVLAIMGRCYNCDEAEHPVSGCIEKQDNAEHAAFTAEPTEFAMTVY